MPPNLLAQAEGEFITPPERNIMNDRRIRCTQGDLDFSALVRKEYSLLGLGVEDLQAQLEIGKYHARSLWEGGVLWKLPENIGVLRTPGIAAWIGDVESDDEDIRMAFITYMLSPYLTDTADEVVAA
jgi:hypothetical protein